MAVALVIAALVHSATDVLALVAALAAALAGIGYIIKLVRAGFRRIDEFTELAAEEVPKRLDTLEQQREEDRDEHKAAHAEMLSAVTALAGKVDALGERLEELGDRQEQDHDHLEALTRDLDVPVRRRRRAA